MQIDDILDMADSKLASDVHLTVGMPPVLRIDGDLIRVGEQTLSPTDLKAMIHGMLTPDQINRFEAEGQLDFSYVLPGKARFRVNTYKQRGSYGMAARLVNSRIPSFDELGLPNSLEDLARKKRGLVLVTGPTGSGKSTTLASMIDLINTERACHVMTLEDPIEYLHHHKKSMVNQREVGNDTNSFEKGLRAALREDPDVILVGEMRDLETISIAITAAETGHLVFSTLHTQGAAATIDRAIDVFPPHQQQQIRIQLAAVLEGVISQQLLPKKDTKGRVAAFEVLLTNNAVRNLIRENKTHQIQTVIQTGKNVGMQTMDASLVELFRKGHITEEIALNHSYDLEQIKKDLRVF
jgi:twitching motility protein PilT